MASPPLSLQPFPGDGAAVMTELPASIRIPADAPCSAPALQLYAAGSLTVPMTAIAAAYHAETGGAIEATFSPAGLLRRQIAAGAPADLFASADMNQPQMLTRHAHGGPVVLFARNRLCVISRPGLAVTPDTLLDALLDPGLRLGMSTPGSDPSGDYVLSLFRKAETLRPGSEALLRAKALELTGCADSPPPPPGRNGYAALLGDGRADLFVTYGTNALLARQDSPELEIVCLPPALTVEARYGLLPLRRGGPAALALALFILSPTAQAILADHGFQAPTLP